MRHQLAQLARNLAAGLRLALFLPVTRLAFRIDVPQLLLLFALSALIDVGTDWVRAGPDGFFSWGGAGSEVFAGGMLMLGGALLALAYRQPALTLAIPVLLLAAFPLLQLVQVLPALVPEVPFAWAATGAGLDLVGLLWGLALLVRTVGVALVPGGPQRWLRATAGGMLLSLPMWVGPLFMENMPWWEDASAPGDATTTNAASELVLTAQGELLDDALSALDDERPGVTDLYFVGFAGDARQEGYLADVNSAQRVMDERWDTRGRSILLANNADTMLDLPIASLTHLRATLTEIGAAIDPEVDVVMLYIASSGIRGGRLEAVLPPLDLLPLTGPVVRALLDEAGIRWRIIVVSACASGAWVEALEDDSTLILTATRPDESTPACAVDADGTALGKALFEGELAKSSSLAAAVDAARARLPAGTMLSIGSAMVEKLKELERGSAARRAGRSV
jgi:hypothetical protein